jgi:membrane protein insertase Oxa1/YidC/SpoIIIJ
VPGLTFPIGLLVYLACTNTISLIQQLIVIRWLPTPGSPAAARG